MYITTTTRTTKLKPITREQELSALEQKLHPEQSYLILEIQRQEIPIRLVTHEYSTESCQEKAETLKWDTKRIIKAMYFADRLHTICVIAPGTQRIKTTDIIAKSLRGTEMELSRKEASRYHLKRQIPYGMQIGTCTPFALRDSVGYEIHDFIIIQDFSLDDIMVDIAIGGKNKKVSLQLPYSAIYNILEIEFPNRVHLYN